MIQSNSPDKSKANGVKNSPLAKKDDHAWKAAKNQKTPTKSKILKNYKIKLVVLFQRLMDLVQQWQREKLRKGEQRYLHCFYCQNFGS